MFPQWMRFLTKSKATLHKSFSNMTNPECPVGKFIQNSTWSGEQLQNTYFIQYQNVQMKKGFSVTESVQPMYYCLIQRNCVQKYIPLSADWLGWLHLQHGSCVSYLLGTKGEILFLFSWNICFLEILMCLSKPFKQFVPASLIK